MRVTSNMLTNNLVRNMRHNLKSLIDIQDEMASGSKIKRPSDNPVGVVDVLTLRSDLGECEQYNSNIKNAKTFMEITDGALDDAVRVLQRARELAVSGANGTLPQESQKALAQEIDQLKEQLMQIANTKGGNSYIFGGTRNSSEPCSKAGEWSGNEEQISYEVAPGVTLAVNCNGKTVFTGTGDDNPDAFQVLEDLAANLEAGESEEISTNRLGELEKTLDRFIEERGQLGARVNRADLSLDRFQQQQIMKTELLAGVEDTDIAESIVNLKTRENVYRAALATGARIIMPTLIDFLR